MQLNFPENFPHKWTKLLTSYKVARDSDCKTNLALVKCSSCVLLHKLKIIWHFAGNKKKILQHHRNTNNTRILYSHKCEIKWMIMSPLIDPMW